MATRRQASTTAQPRRKKTVTAQATPDAQAVARRAYELFLDRGGDHGHELTDWLRAEHELSGTPPPGEAAP